VQEKGGVFWNTVCIPVAGKNERFLSSRPRLKFV